MDNKYLTLRAIDVSKHIEKKNNLSYLSWAWAVDQLLQQDHAATWEYKEPIKFGATLMVFCAVTAFGKTMTAQLPVMDHRNKAIAEPDAFQVNVAMQRCLAKAIALHGIGLYIYAGEDLPEDSAKESVSAPNHKSVSSDTFDGLPVDVQTILRDLAMEVIAMIAKGKLNDAYDHIQSQELDADSAAGLWSLFDSKQRSALKSISQQRKAA